jgi:hypothetical protein
MGVQIQSRQVLDPIGSGGGDAAALDGLGGPVDGFRGPVQGFFSFFVFLN